MRGELRHRKITSNTSRIWHSISTQRVGIASVGTTKPQCPASKAQAPNDSVCSPWTKALAAGNATHITSNRKLSPMATTTTYDLKFVGSPATNAARLKALAHGGPLVVALDHRLTAMMPDAFDDAPGGGKTVLPAWHCS